MERNTAETVSVVLRRDADVHERKRRRERAPAKRRTTQRCTMKNGRAHDSVTGATMMSPATGDWYDLFPSEHSSQVQDDRSRVRQIGSRAGTLFATPTSHFENSSNAIASHVRSDARPPGSIMPSLAVDARSVARNLVRLDSPTTHTTSGRLSARLCRLMTWLRTASPRPTMLMLGTHIWPFRRGARVLGSLACLALIGLSAPIRFSASADTSAHRDFAIAAAPKVGIPTVAVSQSSSLEGAASPRDHAGSPVSAASSPRLGVADSTGTPAPRRGVRSSASVKSTWRVTAPAGVKVFVGTLVVTSTPAGATVIMNQRYVGKTPLEVSVKSGPYAVTLELDGAR
jgi:hypothetical protein